MPPGGIAVAPAAFGTLSNALLIGNFGDGKINGFDAGTGAFIHAVSDAAHNPIVTGGLWALWFGNGGRNQPATTLYLTAGINAEGQWPVRTHRSGRHGTGYRRTHGGGHHCTDCSEHGQRHGEHHGECHGQCERGKREVSGARGHRYYRHLHRHFRAVQRQLDFRFRGQRSGYVDRNRLRRLRQLDSIASIAVTVNNVADVTPPTVNITTPTAGDVTGTVTVTAAAADNVGIAQVQFFAGCNIDRYGHYFALPGAMGYEHAA